MVPSSSYHRPAGPNIMPVELFSDPLMANQTTRLLIADDSEALRIGLRMIFGLDRTLDITAETGSADEMETLALHTRPHVIVFDADMSGADRSVSEILRHLPECRIIALTMQTNAGFHQFLRELGVTAVIETRASPLELLDAVQAARKTIPLQ
jgi:DNA-binding NarL/FixJ family response regulator